MVPYRFKANQVLRATAYLHPDNASEQVRSKQKLDVQGFHYEIQIGGSKTFLSKNTEFIEPLIDGVKSREAEAPTITNHRGGKPSDSQM